MKKTKFKIHFIFVLATLFIVSCELEQKSEKQKVLPVSNSKILSKKITSLPTVNVKENDRLNSPYKIIVNSEGIWFASEGELGWAQLVDNNGNELAKAILMAQGDWMKSGPVKFSAIMKFEAGNIKKGKLIIHNNPGEGDGDEAGGNISFEIPVTF